MIKVCKYCGSKPRWSPNGLYGLWWLNCINKYCKNNPGICGENAKMAKWYWNRFNSSK